MRLITNSDYLAHCKPLFISLKVLTLPSLYIYHSVCAIHKNRTDYVLNSDCHEHNTRGADLIRPPRYRLSRSYRVKLDVNLYNLIPSGIKMLDHSAFRVRLKQFLLSNAFYSVRKYVDTLSAGLISFRPHDA